MIVLNCKEDEFKRLKISGEAVIQCELDDTLGFIFENRVPNCSNINRELKPYIVLYVTDDCNLCCEYCFNKNNIASSQYGEPQYSIEELILFLKKNKLDGGTIRFFGGEPLLNFDWIKNCIAGIKKSNLNFQYNIFTNATLFTDEIAEYININNVKLFLSVEAEQIDSKRVDINGNSVNDIVKKNIDLLSRHNLSNDSVARSVYSSREGISIYEYATECLDMGLGMVSIVLPWYSGDDSIVYDSEKLEKLEEQLLDFAKKYVNDIKNHNFKYVGIHPFSSYIISVISDELFMDEKACGIGDNLISISTEGKIYPCPILNGRADMEVGNIKTIHIKSRINNAVVSHLEKCEVCRYKYVCRTRCIGDAYSKTGCFEPLESNCIGEDIMLKTAIYIITKLKGDISDKEFRLFKKIIMAGDKKYAKNNR